MNQSRKILPQSQGNAVIDAVPRALDLHQPDVGSDDGFDGDISIASIFQILWERKWWILLATTLGGLLALGYSLLQTPMYRAVTTIELNPPTVPVLSRAGRGGEDMVVPTTDRQFQATQIGILRSRALAERVVQDLSLVSAAQAEGSDTGSANRVGNLAAGLAARLAVRPLENSRLIELSYESDNPAEAARLADGFGESFIALTLDRKYAATTSAREFLEERISTVREEINDAERKLVDYAKEKGIVVLAGESQGENSGGTLTGNSLSSLNAALALAQQKRITAEQRFRQASSLSEGNSGSAALRQEKAALEAEYREKATFLQPSFPEMVRLKTRIDELERQISGENSLATDSLRGEYQAALAEERSLQSRVAQLSGNVLREREDAIQYNILQRELDTSRSLYDALLARYNEVGVVEGIGTAQAALVDRARVPSRPFAPSTIRNTLLGVLLGLFLGSGLAILYDRFTDTFKTKDDIRTKLGIAGLGAIPLAQEGDKLIDEVRDPISNVYDAYATLRTNIQLSQEKGFPKVLLVTSSRPEEGKSSTSYSLAVQLADIGKRVLLIDADMRRPSFFAEGSGAGLSTLLTSETTLFEHVNSTSSGDLFLLPSGPIPPNPASIILPVRLNALLDEARKQFDHIIMDAPPVAGFADAILLASCSDGVLFAIECGKTRAITAQNALNQLKMSGANILGGTLTKASARAVDYSAYGYYYGDAAREDSSRIELGPSRAELDSGDIDTGEAQHS